MSGVIAADTNIVVRLLTADDAAQLARARRLFESSAILLPKTVVLEAEWVLRRLYGLRRPEVVRGLRALIALPQVQCEDTSAVSAALDWALQGMDFADALHIASSPGAEHFASFDRSLARHAKKVEAGLTVVAP